MVAIGHTQNRGRER
jgi:hypothetical protein